ncbi:MAG: EpsG family protein [Butyrivibrio sp.]|uniref:EpsG family protein n=1 Tax=Butyrivibrio sp. TaxID=28121 RepID=UPI0025F2A1AC|nr:EpsG family protein [Butyrivibrio sp.]MCR5772053.1 EpsG family protein [Butyrivibrio sp.]
MWVYLLLTLLTIGLAFNIRKAEPESNGQYVYIYKGISRQHVLNIISMVSIFIMLFAVSALRLNVGNDYAKYTNFMHLIYSNAYVPTEIGFNILVWVIYFLSGYENYLLVFAIFAFITILLFLYAMNELSESFRWSFVMFMLLTYYFQTLSTVRYYLALGAALLALVYIKKGDWPRFIFVALLGACFHKSLLVILVLYPICCIKWKRWMVMTAGIMCLSFLFLQDYYLKLLLIVYPSYKDTDLLEGGTSYIAIARCVVVLVFAFLYRDRIKDSKMNIIYVKCNTLALLLYVFCSFIPVISRIGYYLTITQILLVPAILESVEDETRKKIYKLVFLIVCILYFLIFMWKQAPADGVRILPYDTFLLNDMVPLEYEILD